MTQEDIHDILMRLVKELWMLNDIDMHANFFDLGITSQELITFCGHLARSINREVNIILLYQYPNFNLLLNKITELCNE